MFFSVIIFMIELLLVVIKVRWLLMCCICDRVLVSGNDWGICGSGCIMVRLIMVCGLLLRVSMFLMCRYLMNFLL